MTPNSRDAARDLRLSAFEARIGEQRARLLQHPLYERLGDPEAVKRFMALHVFAVWDFMSLLKALQRNLTCVEVPWLPPRDPQLARFINEIVLAEESDDIGAGEYLSHFELYLRAMGEVGADPKPILGFLERVRNAADVDGLLSALSHQHGVFDFVRVTLQIAKGPPHVVAASFLFGREDLIPEMFARVLAVLPAAPGAYRFFRQYLERHIQVDGDHHGPLARNLLVTLCEDSAEKWQQAEAAAVASIEARLQLWDCIACELPASV